MLREAARLLPPVAGFAMDLTRSSRELIAESTLLRHQLIVGSRKVKRPVFRPHERGLLVLLARLARRWPIVPTAQDGVSGKDKEPLARRRIPYFNPCRPHRGIRQRIPVSTSRTVFDGTAKVIAIPVLKGLHHDYRVAA